MNWISSVLGSLGYCAENIIIFDFILVIFLQQDLENVGIEMDEVWKIRKKFSPLV